MQFKTLLISVLLPVAAIWAQASSPDDGSEDDTSRRGYLRERSLVPRPRLEYASQLCIATDIAPYPDAHWSNKCSVGDAHYVYRGKVLLMQVTPSGGRLKKTTWTLLPDTHYAVRNAGLSGIGASDVRKNLYKWSPGRYPYTYCTTEFDTTELRLQTTKNVELTYTNSLTMNEPKWASTVFKKATGINVSARDSKISSYRDRFTVCKLGQSIMKKNGD